MTNLHPHLRDELVRARNADLMAAAAASLLAARVEDLEDGLRRRLARLVVARLLRRTAAARPAPAAATR